MHGMQNIESVAMLAVGGTYTSTKRSGESHVTPARLGK